jgi:catechol 2,3-dioxygenase-like lactoylglutathione lyase family enzyme
MKPLPSSHVRIARPSRDLRRTERFWVDGLGLDVLYRADSSAEGGHALLMAGWPGAAWHLEFVDDREGETPAAPTEEDLLVLYLDGGVEEGAINRLVDAGGTRVVSRNPYWDHGGVTIADPDGYRLVLTSRSWSSPVIAKDLCTYKIVILRQGRGPEFDLQKRGRAAGYRACLPSTSTPAVANMPPLPRITLMSGPSTCAAASPRIWRTPSWMANIPYIPVWV